MNPSLFVICFILIYWLLDEHADLKKWRAERNRKPLQPKSKKVK